MVPKKRPAVEQHTDRAQKRKRKESSFDLANRFGIIGIVKLALRDLSTNRQYFRGFGK